MSERLVLVTAVGGGSVGEQLVKALRLAPRPYRIVGADRTPHSVGLQDVDLPVLLPPAADPDYVATLLDLCERLGIRAVFPGSEPELLALSRARAELAAAGLVLFANSPEVVAIGLDKGKTAELLAREGFEPPRTLRIGQEADLAAVPFLPAVLKPGSGGGSANVFVAQDADELRLFGRYLLRNFKSCIAQEYVGTADHEYTVGVLSGLDGTLLHSIAVRRSILPAFSNRSRVPNRMDDLSFGDQLVVSNGITQGEIGTFPEVTGPCERIATALASRGPLNLQCRLVDGAVRVFEINPRFSGSASLRAMAGFNEPDLLYRREIEAEVIAPRFAYRSGRIGRGLREVWLDPALEQAGLGAGDFHWSLPPLPFIYRPLETPHNGPGLPDALPLTLGLDQATGRLRQLEDPRVSAALERAYQVGSEIPGLMEAQGIGKEYAEDFLALLRVALSTRHLAGLRVLEIGCGTGYLLSRLQQLGAAVTGIEPGPHAGAQLGRDVRVIRDWFPSSEVPGPYDLIIAYLVLEHLPDPASFLAEVRSRLAPQGRVALVVPDCGPFLAEGDASILFHEHYSYFTEATLSATLQQAGAGALTLMRSPLSRLLFALASFEGTPAPSVPSQPAESLLLAHRFRRSVAATLGRLRDWLAEARQHGPVAIYVPGRFVNYLALGGLSTEGLRFFDDSAALHGRYYPGVPVPVESLDALREAPCAHVLVMSASFGEPIQARLRPLLPPSTRITTLAELLR